MSLQLDSIYEIIVLALGLAGFVWLAKSDFKKAVYLVIFLLPFYLLKIKILVVPFNVSEILIWLLFLVWLIDGRYKSAKIGRLKSYGWPTLLILAGVGFGVLISENFSVSAGILKGWFVAPIIFGLVAALEIKKEDEIKDALFWLAASAGLVGVVALLYFMAGKTTFDGRLAAFYLSPNQLAMYLAPGFIIGVGLFKLSANRKEKAALLGSLAFISASLYLTYSYAAWLSVIIVTIFFIFLKIGESRSVIPGLTRNPDLDSRFRGNDKKGRRPVAYRKIFIGLLLLLFSILFFLQVNSEKMDNLLYSSRSSWQSRLVIWQAAWLIGKDHPVFGIGPGLFQEYYLRYQKYFSIPYLEWAVPQPHNLFLAFWLQAGLLGLFGFFWLLVLFYKKIAKLILAQNQLAIILASLMTYTLLHGLVDTTYFKNDLAVIFWLMAALLASLSDSFDWQKD